MSEQAAPQAEPQSPGQGNAPRRLSGLLLVSLGLSFGSILLLRNPIGVMLLLVGPVAAGFLAWMGRRRALADPTLIGPKFAIWCMIIAGASLVVQGYGVYQGYPVKAFWDEVVRSQRTFLDGRDYDQVYEAMAPSYRATHTVEDLNAALAAAITEKDEIDLEQAELRQDDIDSEDLQVRGQEFLSETTGDFEFNWPIRLKLATEDVDLDFLMKVTRASYAEFSAEILDFTVVRKERAEAAPEEKPADPPEDGSGK